jgi:hypothetical protein
MDTQPLSAKEYLSQAYRIDQRINSKLEQIRSLRILAEKAGAALSEVPPDKNTRNVHRMEDVLCEMIDLESEIKTDMTDLIHLKREVVTIIKCVEQPELQTILELRYLCFKTWEEIAVELHLDIRWVHRLHNRALNEVDTIRRSSE